MTQNKEKDQKELCIILFLIFLASFSFLLFFLPVELEILYEKKRNQNNVSITLNHLKTFRFHMKFPAFYNMILLKKENNRNRKKSNISLFRIHNLSRWLKIIKFLFKIINFKIINLKIYIYNNNPAITSILTGIYWCVIGSLLSFLSSKIDFNNIDISVQINPLFVKREDFSEISFNSIFCIRAGYIIIISIIAVLLISYYKLWSLIVKRSDNFGRTSDRRTNQDCYGKH